MRDEPGEGGTSDDGALGEGGTPDEDGVADDGGTSDEDGTPDEPGDSPSRDCGPGGVVGGWGWVGEGDCAILFICIFRLPLYSISPEVARV